VADARRVRHLFVRPRQMRENNKDAKGLRIFLRGPFVPDAQSRRSRARTLRSSSIASADGAQAADHAQQEGIRSLKSKLAAQVVGHMDAPLSYGPLRRQIALRRGTRRSVYVADEMQQILSRRLRAPCAKPNRNGSCR